MVFWSGRCHLVTASICCGRLLIFAGRYRVWVEILKQTLSSCLARRLDFWYSWKRFSDCVSLILRRNLRSFVQINSTPNQSSRDGNWQFLMLERLKYAHLPLNLRLVHFVSSVRHVGLPNDRYQDFQFPLSSLVIPPPFQLVFSIGHSSQSSAISLTHWLVFHFGVCTHRCCCRSLLLGGIPLSALGRKSTASCCFQLQSWDFMFSF